MIYQDRPIHVAGWAKRFLFDSGQLDRPIASLSGGEQARVLIARLMLQPADLLLLDEPTNDLDIPTLEVLEESLAEFPGALVLVTHDRFLLDRVSTAVLGLDGQGGAEVFADYWQWEAAQGRASQTGEGSRRRRRVQRLRRRRRSSLIWKRASGSKWKRGFWKPEGELEALHRGDAVARCGLGRLAVARLLPEGAGGRGPGGGVVRTLGGTGSETVEKRAGLNLLSLADFG